MAVSITQVNTAAGADTFDILYTRLNQMANAMSTVMLSSAANTVGGQTTGNAALSGIFQATWITATNGLRGGNVAVANTLNVVSNVVVGNSSDFTVGNSTVNTYINSTSIVVNTATIHNLNVASLTLGSAVTIGAYQDSYFTYATTNTSAQVVDSFLFSTYRSAEYHLQVKDQAGTSWQVSKCLVLTDGVDAFFTEYAQIVSNTSLGTFSASINTTACQLFFTPTANVNTIKAFRKSMGT